MRVCVLSIVLRRPTPDVRMCLPRSRILCCCAAYPISPNGVLSGPSVATQRELCRFRLMGHGRIVPVRPRDHPCVLRTALFAFFNFARELPGDFVATERDL